MSAKEAGWPASRCRPAGMARCMTHTTAVIVGVVVLHPLAVGPGEQADGDGGLRQPADTGPYPPSAWRWRSPSHHRPLLPPMPKIELFSVGRRFWCWGSNCSSASRSAS